MTGRFFAWVASGFLIAATVMYSSHAAVGTDGQQWLRASAILDLTQVRVIRTISERCATLAVSSRQAKICNCPAVPVEQRLSRFQPD
jgi:hypothetical protein